MWQPATARTGKAALCRLGSGLRAILEEACTIRGDTPTVFVTGLGKPWTTDGLTEAFRRVSVHAGLGRLGPHVLRHTFALRLVMAGVDLRTVQELLGHKDITQTMRYTHLSPHHTRAAMEALESRFPAKSPVSFHNTPLVRPTVERRKVAAIR